MPVAIYPGHITRRIGAQRSCFTVHGSDQRGLERIIEDIDSALIKITIPSWEAKAIRRSLDACGVDESTVFPDLDGLSKAIEARWVESDEGLPHREVHTRLRPSRVHKGGVGVFAIRRIRKNTPLFPGDNDEMVWVKKSQLPKAPKSISQLYEDFAVVKTDAKDKVTRYGCPVTFNRLTPSWYLNHSLKPNVAIGPNYDFFALKDIESGEELTVNYSTYSEKV